MFSNLPILSFITFVPAFVAILLIIFSRLTAETGRAHGLAAVLITVWVLMESLCSLLS